MTHKSLKKKLNYAGILHWLKIQKKKLDVDESVTRSTIVHPDIKERVRERALAAIESNFAYYFVKMPRRQRNTVDAGDPYPY